MPNMHAATIVLAATPRVVPPPSVAVGKNSGVPALYLYYPLAVTCIHSYLLIDIGFILALSPSPYSNAVPCAVSTAGRRATLN